MKKILRFSIGFLSLLALSTLSLLRADTLLGFDLTGLTGSETVASSTFQASGVNASTLSRGAGAGASASNFANTDIFNVNADGNSGFNATSLSAAISGNQYYQWTFSSTATASLSSLNYSVYAQNNGASPENFSGDIQYSLDGFTTAGVDLGGFTGVTPQSGDNNYLSNPESNDLSGVAALQNITAGQTITFRFYGYDGAGYTDHGFGRAGSSDLVISGILVVPEPSTVALMSFAFVGLLAVLRFGRAR